MICLQKQATNTPSCLQKCFEKPQEANGHKELPTSDAPESPPTTDRAGQGSAFQKEKKTGNFTCQKLPQKSQANVLVKSKRVNDSLSHASYTEGEFIFRFHTQLLNEDELWRI